MKLKQIICRQNDKYLNENVFNYFNEFKKLKHVTILTGSLDVYVKYFVKKWTKFLCTTELELKTSRFTGNIINSNCIEHKKFLKINNLLKKIIFAGQKQLFFQMIYQICYALNLRKEFLLIQKNQI